jgi:hypothetical protein
MDQLYVKRIKLMSFSYIIIEEKFCSLRILWANIDDGPDILVCCLKKQTLLRDPFPFPHY